MQFANHSPALAKLGTGRNQTLVVRFLGDIQGRAATREVVSQTELEYRPICLGCGANTNGSAEREGRLVVVEAGEEVPSLGGKRFVKLPTAVRHGVCTSCAPDFKVGIATVTPGRAARL